MSCKPLMSGDGEVSPHQSPTATASVSASRAAYGGYASTRACGRSPLGKPSVSKNLPLRGRCPEGAEGENLAIARNISGSRTVLSPTACGRSPLAEGAKG